MQAHGGESRFACHITFYPWIMPPCTDLVAIKRRPFGPFQRPPIGDPLFRQIEQGHDVVTGQKNPVERAHGGDEVISAFRGQEGGNHGIHRFALYTSKVEQALW